MKQWTVEYAQEMVNYVKEYVKCSETAHSREDSVYLQFIEWIAESGTKQQREIASILLSTQSLPIDRWYA